jgi:phage-related protein
MRIKLVEWLGDSRDRVRGFPVAARGELGFQLWEVQQGNEPSDWKPMPSVGLGVNEIRVRVDNAYRLIYVARFSEAVYVLHAFEKKSRKTSKPDVELARERFRTLVNERRRKR